MRTFKLVKGPHDNWSILLNDASKEEHRFLRRAMIDPYMGSPFYKARQAGSMPFLQGGSHLEEGYIYIEFWCTDYRTCEKYVEFLNEKAREE